MTFVPFKSWIGTLFIKSTIFSLAQFNFGKQENLAKPLYGRPSKPKLRKNGYKEFVPPVQTVKSSIYKN